MASISKDAGGNIRILFIGADKKRRTIRLGAVPKKLAEAVKLRVEALAAAAAARVPVDTETAAWVGGIGDDLAAKLAAVGLIPERPKAVTLAGLLDLYLTEKESGNKTGTKTNHRTISNDLIGFFGASSDPRAITRNGRSSSSTTCGAANWPPRRSPAASAGCGRSSPTRSSGRFSPRTRSPR